MKKIIEILKLKWAEYLLEIIVIVVGVLGAFALDNWNEQNKNSVKEKVYLSDIHKDFKKNKNQFELVQASLERGIDVSDSLISIFPITEDNWPEMVTVYWMPFYHITFDPINSSVESLINSGQIELIKSHSLKRLLISWKDEFLDYKQKENELKRLANIREDILLNVQGFWDTNVPLSNSMFRKLERLLKRRRGELQMIMWRNPRNDIVTTQFRNGIMTTMDSIIYITK
jgi:hypothetical protein